MPPTTESITMIDSMHEFSAQETITPPLPEGAINTIDTSTLLEKEAPIIVHNIAEVNAQIVQHFTEHLRVNFEEFSYHNIEHSKAVLEMSLSFFDDLAALEEGKKLLLDIKVSNNLQDQNQQLTLLRTYLTALALGHDSVQSVSIDPITGKLSRNRGMDVGQSEGESARLIYNYLKKFKYADGREVFDALDSQTVFKHIDSTTVTADFTYINSPFVKDGEKVLVINTPSITSESDPIDFIIAFSDLKRASGGDNPTAFIEEGFAEFRELNPWLQELAKRGVDNLTSAELASAGSAILKWTAMQRGFAAAQKEVFHDFIGKIKAAPLVDVLTARVNDTNFTENILAVTGMAEMQEFTYRLSILALEIQSYSEKASLSAADEQALNALTASYTRLQRTGKYIVPGDSRHTTLSGSAPLDARNAINDLFVQAGFIKD